VIERVSPRWQSVARILARRPPGHRTLRAELGKLVSGFADIELLEIGSVADDPDVCDRLG